MLKINFVVGDTIYSQFWLILNDLIHYSKIDPGYL